MKISDLFVLVVACCMTMLSEESRCDGKPLLSLDAIIPDIQSNTELDALHIRFFNEIYGSYDSDDEPYPAQKKEKRSDRRRLRALQRGYICPVPHGYVLLPVPRALAARMKSQLDALVLHQECVELTGNSRHFLGSAIVDASGIRVEAATRRAHKVNQKAAKDRHDWDLDVNNSIAGSIVGMRTDLGESQSACSEDEGSICSSSVSRGISMEAGAPADVMEDEIGKHKVTRTHKIVDMFDGDDGLVDEVDADFFCHLGRDGALHVDKDFGDSDTARLGTVPSTLTFERDSHGRPWKDSDTARFGSELSAPAVEDSAKDAEIMHGSYGQAVRRWVDILDSGDDTASSSDVLHVHDGIDIFDLDSQEGEADKTLHADTPTTTRWELNDGIWTKVAGGLPASLPVSHGEPTTPDDTLHENNLQEKADFLSMSPGEPSSFDDPWHENNFHEKADILHGNNFDLRDNQFALAALHDKNAIQDHGGAFHHGTLGDQLHDDVDLLGVDKPALDEKELHEENYLVHDTRLGKVFSSSSHLALAEDSAVSVETDVGHMGDVSFDTSSAYNAVHDVFEENDVGHMGDVSFDTSSAFNAVHDGFEENTRLGKPRVSWDGSSMHGEGFIYGMLSPSMDGLFHECISADTHQALVQMTLQHVYLVANARAAADIERCSIRPMLQSRIRSITEEDRDRWHDHYQHCQQSYHKSMERMRWWQSASKRQLEEKKAVLDELTAIQEQRDNLKLVNGRLINELRLAQSKIENEQELHTSSFP